MCVCVQLNAGKNSFLIALHLKLNERAKGCWCRKYYWRMLPYLEGVVANELLGR